jgi:hypothetical protein
VGYEMEMRVKFECGIWLRNGNFMAVKSITNKRLNTSSICKENVQMGWLQMELKIFNLKDVISRTFFNG